MNTHDLIVFVNRLKQKPEHVRERIAFLSASGVTVVIALAWLVGTLASGLFNVASAPAVTQTPANPNYAAASAAAANANAPAGIRVINVEGSTSRPAEEQTVIPF